MRVSSLSKRTVKLVSKTGTKVLTTLRYRDARDVLVVDPQRRLAPGTTYRLTISTGARDLAGNPLATATTVRFTTRR